MTGRPRRLEAGCLLLLAVLIWYQTLSLPLIGMADNGDFMRVMWRFGMAQVAATTEDRYLFYASRVFAIDPKVHWSLGSMFQGFVSSENFLMGAAVLANQPITKYSGYFDIRVLGLLHASLLFGGAALALWALARRRIGIRVVVCLAVLLAFADGTYVAYFNSVYTEAGVIGFYALMIGAAVAIIEAGEVRSWILPAIFIASGLLLAIEKNPYFIFGPFVLAFCWRVRFWDANRTRRLAILGGAALAALLSLVYLNTVPVDMRQAYLYNMLFAQILPSSTNADADLRAMGLDPELKKYSGTYAYQVGIDFGSDYFKDKLYNRAGLWMVVRYYQMHPLRALPLIGEGLNWGWKNEPLRLGNFEKSAGQAPGARSTVWRMWSGFKSNFSGLGWVWSIVLFGTTLVVNRVLYRRTPDRKARLYCDLQVMLVVLALLQVCFVVFSQGTLDLERKMLSFNLLVDTILVINICAAVEWFRERLFTPAAVDSALAARVS